MAVTTQGVLCYKTQIENFGKPAFIAFFANVLNCKPAHCNTIIMDNISFHHSREVKELAYRHGVQIVYPPPYSPEFNPIELVFARLAFSEDFFTSEYHSDPPSKTHYGI
jgi:transposase